MAYYGGNAYDDDRGSPIDRFNSSHLNETNTNNFTANDDDADDNEHKYDDQTFEDTRFDKPVIVEKNQAKELEIYDPIKRQNLEFIPAMIKVPTISTDPSVVENKKLITDKQKFLGIGKIPFIIIIIALVAIILIGIIGITVSAVLMTTDPTSSYEWKIFGIIISSLGILIAAALLVILLIYTNIRYKKYKKALLEEIKHTDADGNPVKTTELDKIYKFSKPIKNAKPTNRQIKTYAPPPKVKSPPPSIRVQPIPLPVQPKPTFIIRQTPVPAPVQVRQPLFANIVKKIQMIPKKVAIFNQPTVRQPPSRSLVVSPTLISISPNSVSANSRQALVYQNQPQAIPYMLSGSRSSNNVIQLAAEPESFQIQELKINNSQPSDQTAQVVQVLKSV